MDAHFDPYLRAIKRIRRIENVKTKDYATMLYNNTVSNEELIDLLPGMYEELKKMKSIYWEFLRLMMSIFGMLL